MTYCIVGLRRATWNPVLVRRGRAAVSSTCLCVLMWPVSIMKGEAELAAPESKLRTLCQLRHPGGILHEAGGMSQKASSSLSRVVAHSLCLPCCGCAGVSKQASMFLLSEVCRRLAVGSRCCYVAQSRASLVLRCNDGGLCR